jgi:hypothetical protein
MPRLSCWLVRASLIHLAIGALFGGLILSGKALPLVMGWAWLLLAAHIQLLVGGWLIQLALGMAYWILPRLDGTGDRGRPRAAWSCFAALNSGVLGAATALLVRGSLNAAAIDIGSAQDAVLDLALATGGVLQAVALLVFAWHAWPRLQPIVVPTGA